MVERSEPVALGEAEIHWARVSWVVEGVLHGGGETHTWILENETNWGGAGVELQ